MVILMMKIVKKKKNKYILIFENEELEVFEEVIIKFMSECNTKNSKQLKNFFLKKRNKFL